MADIVTKTVAVKRTSLWSIGVKNWYVFQDMDGNMYQRYSFLMDDVDEQMMILRDGDMVDVSYEELTHPNGSPKRMITAIVNPTA